MRRESDMLKDRGGFESRKSTTSHADSQRGAVASFHALVEVISRESGVCLAGHFGQSLADVSEFARSNGGHFRHQRRVHCR